MKKRNGYRGMMSLLSMVLLLAGCGGGGGGGGGGDDPPAPYTVGGTLTGLAGGQEVVLQNNAGDDLTLTADGAFIFSTPVADGAGYTVTVKTQPTGKLCTASQNIGTVHSGNVANVSVNCIVADVHACACGSVDEAHPCEGNTIEVTVKATTPDTKEHIYRNAVFQWRFNSNGQPAYCGQFANGDFWIAPRAGASVQITNITGNGTIAADDDPILEELGLLDQSTHGITNPDGSFTIVPYGNWKPENDLVPKLPQEFSGVTSIVAAKKRDEKNDSPCGTRSIEGACVDAYHVVTVLESIPARLGADMLRPNITGNTKQFLTLDMFDFGRLPNSTILSGKDADGLEAIRQRWSHSTEAFSLTGVVNGKRKFFSEGGRAYRAHIVHDDYGSGRAAAYNDDLMVIFSDDNTLAEKQKALAAMLTFGLDIYHARFDLPEGTVRAWGYGAAQFNGQFLPPVLLAALLKDASYPEFAFYAQTLGRVSATAQDPDVTKRGPNELQQIYVGNDNLALWGDEPKTIGACAACAYWDDILNSQCFSGATGTCKTNVGSKADRDPYGYIDGSAVSPGWGYMGDNAGPQRALVAAMLLMPEINLIVKYPPLIDYVDRVCAHGTHTVPDPCAPPDPRENPEECDAFRNTGCKYFGTTWGPDFATDETQCIRGSGRFPSFHEKAVDAHYVSQQVETHWKELRGTGADCLSP